MEIVNIIIAFTVFLYAICIGSFLNVVIYRLPLGLNMTTDRSICPNCKKQIKSYDLIPVFSWIILGGKCRNCKTKISIQYPAIELLTGIIITLAYLQFGLTLTFFRLALVFTVLIVISVIDIKEQNIYDITTYSGIAITILFLGLDYFLNGVSVYTYTISAVINFIIYYIIHIVSKKVYGEEVFGLGDVLLAILIGLNIPANYIYFTVFLPFIVALAFTGFYYIYCKILKKEFSVFIPFGPFMATACVIITLYGNEIPFLQSLIF